MFENKLKKISKEIFKDKNLKEYFILTHKKHKREMYFECKNKRALNFAKPKFNSFKKRIIYFLLKLNLIQSFLKKINISEEIGQVVFIGGQIKGFDLNNKITNSFYHLQGNKKSFIKDKEVQKKLAEKGFAPKILSIDKKNLFSIEELFFAYQGKINPLFKKLLEFYNTNTLKKIKLKILEKKIKKYFDKNKIKEPLFNQAFNKINKKNYFLSTKIHGDFAKEQCLIENEKIFFVDWNLRKGLITEDLVNFFRLDDNYFNKLNFKKIIKKYPKHVRENLREYLLLTELLRISNGINQMDLSKRRIKKLLDLY